MEAVYASLSPTISANQLLRKYKVHITGDLELQRMTEEVKTEPLLRSFPLDFPLQVIFINL